MSLSFSGFCEQLGAPLVNKAWSWSAKSPDNSFVVFTVWDDHILNGEYDFATKPRESDVRKKPGRTELIANLNLVLEHGIAAYGIRCKAKDIEANPRSRLSFDSESLLDMRITKQDVNYIGKIVGTVPPDVVKSRGDNTIWISASAINDLEVDQGTNIDPEYRQRMSGSYIRNPKVRKLVLKRAGGRCEECGALGFMRSDGTRYLETHHVISLSEQGPDALFNVIALCPNDHRRAHFGEDWKELQEGFLQKLAQYREKMK